MRHQPNSTKMPHISQQHLEDILGHLPKRIILDDSKEVDLLICTLGFEDRTDAIAHSLQMIGNLRGKDVILVKYPTNKPDNEKNLDKFQKLCDRADCRLKTFNYHKSTFSVELSGYLQEIKCINKRVCFDISTCSSYLLYPIMKVLMGLEIYLRILYCEAENYFPAKDEWLAIKEKADKEGGLFAEAYEKANFLSKGVDQVYSASLFYEMNPGNLSAAIVAIPNFSGERMKTLLEKDYEVNNTAREDIHWIIGVPPGEKNKWRRDALIETNRLQNRDDLLYVSTLEYKEIMHVLEELWNRAKYAKYLSIGSLGSKFQHLGTYLFLFIHQDIGLWLVEPKEFIAGRWSSGMGQSHEVDFGSTSELRKLLESYMTMEINIYD